MRKFLLLASALLSTTLFSATADKITHEFNDFYELGYGTPVKSDVDASNFYPGIYIARAEKTGLLSQVTPETGVVAGINWAMENGAYGKGGFHLGLTPLQHTYFVFYAHPGDMSFDLCGDKTANAGSLYILSAEWNGSAFDLDINNPISSELFKSNVFPKAWESRTFKIEKEGWIAIALDTFKFDNLSYQHQAHTAVGSLKSTWGYPIDQADVNVHFSGAPYTYYTPVKIDNDGKFEIQFHHLETIETASAQAPARASTYSLSTETPISGFSLHINRADFNAPVHIPFSLADADENRLIDLGEFTMGQGTMTGIESAEAGSAVSVSAAGGDIIIRGSYDSAEAYTLSGARTPLISLPAGIYIVRVDGVAHKVAIR